jgi:hypothetical protein
MIDWLYYNNHLPDFCCQELEDFWPVLLAGFPPVNGLALFKWQGFVPFSLVHKGFDFYSDFTVLANTVTKFSTY